MKLSNPDAQAIYDFVETVAVTGTKEGMTREQRRSFKWVLSRFPNAHSLVHGDCIGVDEEAGEIAHKRGWRVLKRPSNLKTRAWSKIGEIIEDPKPPLERNKDIVDQGDCVVACPRTMKEELRSGTWAAVRYARKQDALLWFVWPDGSITGPHD